MKRILRTAALALTSLTWALASACAARDTPEPLRLLSYNIAAGHGDLGRIVDVLRAARPDIVALQEVDVHWGERSRFADQATALGAALGMDVRFGPIYALPGARAAPSREFGLAILSRHPIVEFRNHAIPRLSTQSDDTEPRDMPGFLETVVHVGAARVHVFDTHLDYRADPRVRAQQVAAMLALMPDSGVPVLLMGDLNATPDAAEIRPLLARLRDAWKRGDSAGYTYPATAPVRRIDYVLLSDHFTVIGARVPATQASDHRPVVVDVLLN